MTPVASATPLRLYSFAAAAATALLLALAMPGGPGWWPLLFFALVPLLTAICRLPPMRCACMGMFCGLLYNIGLLYWIVIVLGRYGGLPPWLSVPGMALLTLYMAIYFSLFCLLLNLVLKRFDSGGRAAVGLIWLAPIFWVGLDYLRSVAMTGFPWMDLGYGLYSHPLLLQVADLGGHSLVTFYLVMSNGLLVWLIERLQKPQAQEQNIRPERITAACACIFLVGLGGYSVFRYQQVTIEMSGSEQAEITVVQGNISQEKKWTAAAKENTVAAYLSLSRGAVAEKKVDLMVWPETALPFYPQQDPLVNRVVTFIRNVHVPLLTGAPFFELPTEHEVARKPVTYFNSALLLDAAGRLKGKYDKQHLVPFGEYVPLRSYLPFLEPLVVSVGNFSAGTSNEPLAIGTIKAGVLICFESIFPEISRREVQAGCNLLVNLTNDAWYGRSSAPYQSWAMAVFRAVETRRTLVRSANTGISGFVAPTGVILEQSQLFVPAALTAIVPLCLQQTIFTRGGHWFGVFCLALILPFLLVRRRA